METLFVLLYWPVVGLLILFVSRALLRKVVGPWWNFLLICLPLWFLTPAVFFSVIHLLHLHGLLLQIVGLVPSQHFDGFYQYLYQFWMAICQYWSAEPVSRRFHEERRKKKAAKAARVDGE